MKHDHPMIVRLERLRRSIRAASLVYGLGVWLAFATITGLGLLLLDWVVPLPPAVRAGLSMGWLSFVVVSAWRRVGRGLVHRIDLAEVAAVVDRRLDGSQDRVVTGLECVLDTEAELSPLADRVIAEADRRLTAVRATDVLRVFKPVSTGLVAAACVLSVVTIAWASPSWFQIGANRYALPFSPPDHPARVEINPLDRPRVTHDELPSVTCLEPRGTIEAVPTAKIDLLLQVRDDVAVTALTWSVAESRGPVRVIDLTEALPAPADEEPHVAHVSFTLDLADSALSPGDVVTGWAEVTDGRPHHGPTPPSIRSAPLRIRIVEQQHDPDRIMVSPARIAPRRARVPPGLSATVPSADRRPRRESTHKPNPQNGDATDQPATGMTDPSTDHETPGRGGSAADSPDRPPDELPRAWGHLPPRPRHDIIAGSGEASLARYRDWIDDYFRELAQPMEPPEQP